MNNRYVTEENVFKMLKRKFTRTKNEHILIGLNVCDRGSIEKLLTEGPNPLMTKNEFKANRVNYIKLVEKSISTVLDTPIAKDQLIYDTHTAYYDLFSDDNYFYGEVFENIVEINEATPFHTVELLRERLAVIRKGLKKLFDTYKKEISKTVTKGKPCNILTKSLTKMIKKAVVENKKETLEYWLECVDKDIRDASKYNQNSQVDKLLKDARNVAVERLNVQIKLIDIANKHNDTVANAIVSKIKSQVEEDLKNNPMPTATNESIILSELSMALEEL